MTSATECGRDLGWASVQKRLVGGTTVHRRPAAVRIQVGPDVLGISTIAAAMGVGLVAVAVADTVARVDSKFAQPVFWTGMLLLWVPATVRLVGQDATRNERIALLLLLGMAMYAVGILHSPRYFVGFDEFLHWRTAQDIVRTGKVFNPNPGLPVSPLYPGLEVVTSAVRALTGLSVVVAGRIVVAAARLTMILALYLLYERVGKSSRLAGIATVIYFTNPQFLFFDSSYAYESLGIPLALLALYAVARARAADSDDPIRPTLLVILPVAATVATHHITSFVLVLTLLLLAVLSLFFDSFESRLWFWGIALAGAGLMLCWLYLVAGEVVGYLGPPLSGGVHRVLELIRGDVVARQLFHNYAGPPTPLVDKAASLAFAGITTLALPFGALQIWRTRRFELFTVTLALGSLAYPVSELFHFVPAGAALGVRLSAFVFVSVAFCIAISIVGRGARRLTAAWTVSLVLAGAVLLYGGVATSTAPWLLLPGPYLASADDRSIEAEGMSAALWAEQRLPHNSRVGSDRTNTMLMLTYGAQWPVTPLSDKIDLAPVFLARQLTSRDVALLRGGAIRYLVVDYRLTRSLPWLGFYYFRGESGGRTYKSPIPVAAYKKFDGAIGLSRVFDSGDIVIFEVQR